MEEVLSILNDQSAIGYLATVEDGKPRVRPWGFMFEDKGRLYFCTAKTKDAYRQLIALPYIEYAKTTKDMVWVRVAGKIEFDEGIDVKKRMFEVVPMLKGLYQTPDNPVFTAFYLEHGTAVINDFSPNPARSFVF